MAEQWPEMTGEVRWRTLWILISSKLTYLEWTTWALVWITPCLKGDETVAEWEVLSRARHSPMTAQEPCWHCVEGEEVPAALPTFAAASYPPWVFLCAENTTLLFSSHHRSSLELVLIGLTSMLVDLVISLKYKDII